MTEKRRKYDNQHPIYKFLPTIITTIVMGAGFYAMVVKTEYRVQQLENPAPKIESASGSAYAAEIEKFRWKNQERINIEIKESIKEMKKEIKHIQIILGKNGYAKLKLKENH